ncbi:MAG: prephenate dehydratase domain-containing protein [Candidatus Paceibacterota bacterium]
MKNITFLGPVGATFSHDAYNILSEIYDAPKTDETNCVPANSNSEILGLIRGHEGYGTIAMETLAEGRVAEPLESFIELVSMYKRTEDCPFRIVGAIKMNLHFCLMTRGGVSESSIEKIVAHPKSLGACKGNIAKTTLPTISVSSNGEAARLVSEDEGYSMFAALGPKSASEKYGLKIIDESFEDKEAFTTFFLIAPKSHAVSVGKNNRVLIVYELAHEPGALVQSLLPFAEEGLNLIQIHSVHVGNRIYNFAIEIEVAEEQLDAFERAVGRFESNVTSHLCFGPFEVLSR